MFEEEIHGMDDTVSNEGCDFDICWLRSTHVDEAGVFRRVRRLQCMVFMNQLEPNYEIAWLMRAIACLDLTTLAGDDTKSAVNRLCYKAVHPLSSCFKGCFNRVTTAAVCVYPKRVPDALNSLNRLGASEKVPVASVATGFPSGQYPLKTRLSEIEYCVEHGAKEIDVVISREHVIRHNWKTLYQEIQQMKKACGKAHMKTILATGECGSLENVYKASIVAMMAGSDFIKTSTGKESVNATLPVGLVMCRAIRDYYEMTKVKVGLKPAGGLRKCEDALAWMMLVKEELDSSWLLDRSLFRIGASTLLGDIERRIYLLLTGENPAPNIFLTC